MYTLDSIYEYLVNIILNAEKLNTLTASKIKNKQRYPLLPSPFNMVPVSELISRKKRKAMDWKESESEVAQSCLTIYNPMDCSLPGFRFHGIFQSRLLEWAAIEKTC